ncbi:ribosome maturation factor RimP [Nitrosophilus labii]|uniref:ribosome maturation factor RimP n=1 Tax=Nitrosophilus labii TaxID=2706014 RepID=UPI001656CCD9|nr:ribosome maturation factor RimP [Nitrosophilus labii]
MSLESEIKKIVESCGAKLYDIETVTERGRTIFRVTIKSDEGVDLDLCADISNMISPLLDVNPPVKGDYNLEVSSPGIERKLKKPSHFENSVGELVHIVFDDGTQLKGKLKEVKWPELVIETDRGEEKADMNEIASAKTYFEW